MEALAEARMWDWWPLNTLVEETTRNMKMYLLKTLEMGHMMV